MGNIRLAGLVPEHLVNEQSDAATDAKEKGLQYVSFGRWADPSTGHVVAVTKDGKLVPTNMPRSDEQPEHSAKPESISHTTDELADLDPTKLLAALNTYNDTEFNHAMKSVASVVHNATTIVKTIRDGYKIDIKAPEGVLKALDMKVHDASKKKRGSNRVDIIKKHARAVQAAHARIQRYGKLLPTFRKESERRSTL